MNRANDHRSLGTNSMYRWLVILCSAGAILMLTSSNGASADPGIQQSAINEQSLDKPEAAPSDSERRLAPAEAEAKENRQAKDIIDSCYANVGPLLEASGGTMTEKVRGAFLNWAQEAVLRQLSDQSQSVPEDCLAEVRTDAALRDAMFGSVFPPDPSILQNYAHLRAALGAKFMRRYQSLVVGVSVAKRIKGVETADHFYDTYGRDYQPGFWTDETLQKIDDANQMAFIRGIGEFLKSKNVAAIDLYQNANLQTQLSAFLSGRGIDANLLARISKSVEFGEYLKNAMVVTNQRPAARDPKPDTVGWLKYLASQNQATPSSTPTVNNNILAWPLFPIDKAPWPLLMPLAHAVPLSEAKYMWEKFQGEHGPDRWHTYGPYRGDDDAMPYELQPSRWFWDAWPDRIVWGGECVPISKGTVDLYTAMGQPAMWGGQPGHANLISFQYFHGTWTAEVEQAFGGGPDVTFAQWYFDQDPGTESRHRDLYYWAGAEYQLGLALAMNKGSRSYMDTRLAMDLFKVLPAAQKQTIGMKLLEGALRSNPFNPEIWYLLAQHTSDAMQGLKLVQAAMNHDPVAVADNHGATAVQDSKAVAEATKEYWETLEEFLTQYAILAHSPPKTEADMHRVYALLRSAHGINVDDLITYVDQFAASASNEIQPDAVKYDQNLAGEGDAYGQLRMGERYEDGEGVQRDESRARDLFARAAAQGDMVAALAWEKLFAFIPANTITVSASSAFSPDQIARHLVDGSGLVGAVHDNNYAAQSMWQSIERPMPHPPAPGLTPSPAWVRFDFAQSQNLVSILIWNHNQMNLTDRGFRRTRIYGSSDGITWFPLTEPRMIELPRADGGAFAVPVDIENAAAGNPIKSVIIAAERVNGNFGSTCFGLSAVRFVLEKLGPAVPASLITVTASSVYGSDQIARHLVDGSGMQGNIHDNDSAAQTMWQSSENPEARSPAKGLPPSPAWVRFDFAQPREFDSILIWNHNQDKLTDRGFRKTRIYGSSDGLKWFPLTSPELIELPRADGTALGEAATIANTAAKRPIKSVIIAANDTDGNYGSTFYGLGAVRFVTGN